jgi:RNA polymerase sigma-70 factor (ECF subfamily)
MNGAEQSGQSAMDENAAESPPTKKAMVTETAKDQGLTRSPAQNLLRDPGSTGADVRLAIERFPEYFADLYQKAQAAEFGLDFEEFAAILCEIGAKYLPGGPASVRPEPSDADDRQFETNVTGGGAQAFYAGLRLNELALARACAKGLGQAWDVFLNRYREKLYDAALSIAGEESAGRELADSLYAELFGIGKGDGPRVSKLSSYAGRGSLEGWLRAVLAQEHVNRCRSRRGLVSLEEQLDQGVQFAAERESRADGAVVGDLRLEAATDEALAEITAEDRYIVASYYLDENRLAEIAAVLRVHESTVSRRLEKITTALRKRILKGLRARGMSRDQANEALEIDVRDVCLDVRAQLFRKEPTQEKGSGAVL